MKLLNALANRCRRWLWKVVPDCAEMSRLASLSFDQSLSPATRLKMRLHYLICDWCQRYRKQLRFLRRTAQQHSDELHDSIPARLSDDARARLKRKLRDECE